MRVVSGRVRGRTLKAVPGDTTRPILDRVKTALFDKIRPYIQGARVLDLFAGSGSVGIEALSQGAAHATFVEIAPVAARTVRENLEACGLIQEATIRHTDAFQFLTQTELSFELVYVDPPQFNDMWTRALFALSERPTVVAAGGLVVVKIHPDEQEELTLSGFTLDDSRTYGNSLLLFFKRQTG